MVFNGHVHTTELYEADGVKYLLPGGGGAEQDPILPRRTHNKVPEGYPPDQYWKGDDPKEDYSYLHVEVTPESRQAKTLERGASRSSTGVRHNDQFKNGDIGDFNLIFLDLAYCVRCAEIPLLAHNLSK